MTHQELRDQWLARAEEYRRLGMHVDAAKIVDVFVAELEILGQELGDKTLTLGEAAIESGYSKDYLGRLVRAKQIPNAGRKQVPLIRRRDLPSKARSKVRSTVAKERGQGYDLEADARSLGIPNP